MNSKRIEPNFLNLESKQLLWHVYVDVTTDSATPFYVGKGNASRICGVIRNFHHANIVKKHGLTRTVIFSTNDENEAFCKEIELIAKHHTFVDDLNYNGLGCNYTPGGEGHVPNAMMRKTYSIRLKKRWQDEKERARLIVSMKGKNGKVKSVTWRKLKSEAMKGEGNPNYGKKQSPETREKNRLAHLGKIPWNKGKNVTCNPGRLKPVTVIDNVTNNAVTYVSFKEASQEVAKQLNRSPRTVMTYLVARRPTVCNLTFLYHLSKELMKV